MYVPQLIFTPRCAPNHGGNLHEQNRIEQQKDIHTKLVYNLGQTRLFENG